MKNRILILGLLVLALAIVKLFFHNVEKPIVNYTVNNTFPVVSGDTLSIDFYFESEHNLTFFSSKVSLGVEILNEVVEFGKGNKAGNLNYSFVIPQNCRNENMMNLQFEISSEFGSDDVYISVPVYNPPYMVRMELDQVDNFAEVSVKSFFSSKNLIIENDLLAELDETSGFSEFKVYELQNFNLNDYLYKGSQGTSVDNFIISNLLETSKKLVRDEKNLATASLFSISELNSESQNTKDVRKPILNVHKKSSISKIATKKAVTSNSENSKANNSSLEKKNTIPVANINQKLETTDSDEIAANLSLIVAHKAELILSNQPEIDSNAIIHANRIEFIENKRLNDIKIEIQLGLSDMKMEENDFLDSKIK